MKTKDEIFNKAIEACKKIESFHGECFTGHPVHFVSNGKPINHTLLNEAYDLAYEVLKEIQENKKYQEQVQEAMNIFDNIQINLQGTVYPQTGL